MQKKITVRSGVSKVHTTAQVIKRKNTWRKL